ncbi:MAG TPA: nuclear transport factor 2 family protein [Terriglobia bacterium]|nr:nuclear transport factor 2 family protein [Terriglobia bacterium]
MSKFAAVTRSIFAFGVLGFVLLMSGCAHQSGQADAAQTEKELRTLQDEWAVARIKGDVDFLERFYAQDLRLQVMDGSVVERKDDIAMFDRIRRGDQDTIKPESIRDVDMKVSSYCDTAVVTGVENLKGTYKGKPGEMALRFTNVFVRRDGRWQLVLHHSTAVKAK